MMKLKKYTGELLAILIFGIYLITLAPSVIQIDAGELAGVQLTLGIAHPTGYPLFTLLGYLFSLIPLPFSSIFQLNVLSAIYCSLGILFFYKSAQIFSDVLNPANKTLKTLFTSSIIAGSFFLAFGKTFWFQSTSVEVYSLQILFFNLIIWASLKAYYLKIVSNTERYWYLVAIFLALGFSNHMTTLLLLPGIAFLFFNSKGFNKRAYILILKMLGMFFPVLMGLYSYLPFRASANPIINWGNPINFENFWRHFTGNQYQVWLFASLSSAKKQLAYFFTNFPSEFSVFGLLIILLGFIYLRLRNKTLFNYFIINIIFTVIYSINYDINDIDSYFLLAYINLGFISIFGFNYAYKRILSLKLKPLISHFIIASFVLAIFFLNIKTVNQSGNYAYEDYTKSVLNDATENSLLVSYQWDFLISPSYYFQLAEKFRPDVKIIDKELLRRSWYFNQCEKNFPNVFSGVEPDITNFKEALVPFERGERYNAKALEKYYRNILNGLIANNLNKGDVYIAPELVDNEIKQGVISLPKGFSIVPLNYNYKVVKPGNYLPVQFPENRIRFSPVQDKYTLKLRAIVGGMFLRRALYELSFNMKTQAVKYVNKVRKEFPELRIPFNLRNM